MRRILAALIIILPMQGVYVTGSGTIAKAAGGVRLVSWIQVAPQDPRTLYLGGISYAAGAASCNWAQALCTPWLMRSADAGATWQDLTKGLAAAPTSATYYSPLYLSHDQRHLYLDTQAVISPSQSYNDIIFTSDGGRHWRSLAHYQHWSQENGNGLGGVNLSPLTPRRVYALGWTDNAMSFGVSNDGGEHWTWSPYPEFPAVNLAGTLRLIISDRRFRDTVYVNSTNESGLPTTHFMRSDDAGRHWTLMYAPTNQGFVIIDNPSEATLLVGQPQPPTDRLYVSANKGRTWRSVRCPGDYHHTCPTFTVDNVFGDGASYAFLANGIYRFHGAGAAEMRLALSDLLPFRTAAIVAVGAGRHPKDPIYVATASTFYRSTDAGRRWTSSRVTRLLHTFIH